MSFKSKGLTGKSSLGSEAFEGKAEEEALKSATTQRQLAARELQKKAKTRKGISKGIEGVSAVAGGVIGGYFGGPQGAVTGAKLGKQAGSQIGGVIEGDIEQEANKILEETQETDPQETEKMKRMRMADQPKEKTDYGDKGLQMAQSGLDIAKFLEKIGAFKANG